MVVARRFRWTTAGTAAVLIAQLLTVPVAALGTNPPEPPDVRRGAAPADPGAGSAYAGQGTVILATANEWFGHRAPGARSGTGSGLG